MPRTQETVSLKRRAACLAVAAALLWAAHGGHGLKPRVPDKGWTVLIVHETADDTPAFGAMEVTLRKDEYAKRFEAREHKLLILDDDSVDENKQPAAILKPLAPFKLPELIMLAPTSNKVIDREPCPATADGVFDAVTKAGGLDKAK